MFIHEKASEDIVCEMAAILFRGDELKLTDYMCICDTWLAWSAVVTLS